MNLVVDIGNTSTKIAVFDGKEMILVSRINELSCEELDKNLSPYTIDKAIVSSVINLPPFISDLLFPNIGFVHILSNKSKLPFPVEYDTPETLGSDRLAAVAGAYYMFPGDDIMIIDAGTAITFDFLFGGIYKGGNISPGISMRFKSLNKFTAMLPLVSLNESFSFPGTNTEDAIIAGVVTGVLYEINQYIRTFKKEHSNIKIILTGGDGRYIKEKIEYQAIYLPDIVTDGLNHILEYNANK